MMPGGRSLRRRVRARQPWGANVPAGRRLPLTPTREVLKNKTSTLSRSDAARPRPSASQGRIRASRGDKTRQRKRRGGVSVPTAEGSERTNGWAQRLPGGCGWPAGVSRCSHRSLLCPLSLRTRKMDTQRRKIRWSWEQDVLVIPRRLACVVGRHLHRGAGGRCAVDAGVGTGLGPGWRFKGSSEVSAAPRPAPPRVSGGRRTDAVSREM